MPECEYCGTWYLWQSQAENCCKELDSLTGQDIAETITKHQQKRMKQDDKS